jgi:hypothetical protein
MSTCDKCKANKICDHNKFGFENCNNFIPYYDIESMKYFAEKLWENLRYIRLQDLDIEYEINDLIKEMESRYANR